MTTTTERASPPSLRRSIGRVQALSLVVGIIIGASIFVQPSEITRDIPSVPGILLVWTVAGLLSMAGALLCAELASAFPQAGGVYAFLRELFSPALAFLWGWAMFWSMQSGVLAYVAIVFARYALVFLPLGEAAVPAVAIAAILAVSAINYVGVQYGGRVQAGFTIAKVGAIVLLIVAGVVLGGKLPEHFVGTGAAADVGVGGFIRALAAGLAAFGGWHMVTYAAEETRDPRRTIPWALTVGVLVVIACYVALNAVYLYILPLGTVAQSTRVAADAADALVGSGGARLMAALVVVSAFGGMNGLVLAGTRAYFAMAEDGLFFRWFAAVHPRFHTPHRAIALQAVWAAVLVATMSYRALFTRVVFTEWIFFALLALGLLRMRARPDYAPPYRMPGAPLVPLLFAGGAAAVVFSQILSSPVESAIGILFVAAGLPVYLVWTRIHAIKGESTGADRGRS